MAIPVHQISKARLLMRRSRFRLQLLIEPAPTFGDPRCTCHTAPVRKTASGTLSFFIAAILTCTAVELGRSIFDSRKSAAVCTGCRCSNVDSVLYLGVLAAVGKDCFCAAHQHSYQLRPPSACNTSHHPIPCPETHTGFHDSRSIQSI